MSIDSGQDLRGLRWGERQMDKAPHRFETNAGGGAGATAPLGPEPGWEELVSTGDRKSYGADAVGGN
jgi:hypothetical protein